MKMNRHSETANNDIQTQPLADVYGFLALTMRYPDPSFLTEDFLDVFENLLASLDMTGEQEEIRACRQQAGNLVDTLQVEYTRLFINGVPHIIAPPYGSFYLDGDHTLQGKSTRRARDFYRQYGYDITDTSELADHIRFELEFLAALTRDNELEAEEQFLKTIFRPWFTSFYKRILDEKVHPYYLVSTKLIDLFTKEEQ
jgi:TorA maturation chaperone TorD